MVCEIPRVDVARGLKTREMVTCPQLKKIQPMSQLTRQKLRAMENQEMLTNCK